MEIDTDIVYNGIIKKVNTSGKKAYVHWSTGDPSWVYIKYLSFDDDKKISTVQPSLQEFSSIEGALIFFESLSTDRKLNLLASIEIWMRKNPKKIIFGTILRCVLNNGTIGYGLPVGGGKTALVWIIGTKLGTYMNINWNNVFPTNERIPVENKYWKGMPSEEQAIKLLEKYGLPYM